MIKVNTHKNVLVGPIISDTISTGIPQLSVIENFTHYRMFLSPQNQCSESRPTFVDLQVTGNCIQSTEIPYIPPSLSELSTFAVGKTVS